MIYIIRVFYKLAKLHCKTRLKDVRLLIICLGALGCLDAHTRRFGMASTIVCVSCWFYKCYNHLMNALGISRGRSRNHMNTQWAMKSITVTCAQKATVRASEAAKSNKPNVIEANEQSNGLKANGGGATRKQSKSGGQPGPFKSPA